MNEPDERSILDKLPKSPQSNQWNPPGRPDQASLINTGGYSGQPNQLSTSAEFWPPPPGFPANYTGWGVPSRPYGSIPIKKPIKWPLIIGLAALVFAIILALGGLSQSSQAQKILDKDIATKPLIESGTGTLQTGVDDNDYQMMVNGKTLKLTEILYTGLDGDISASLATAPYYILAAYLPNTKQVVEAQIYDKQGGKLLANFTDFPDANGSYKASLKARYDDASSQFGFTIFAMVVLVGIAGWCGWIVFKRLHA